MTNALTVPAVAVPAQDALDRALRAYVPPCTADPDQWFSDAADARQEAVRGCARCSVLLLCGTYATAAGERHGVWAGSSREPPRRVEVRP